MTTQHMLAFAGLVSSSQMALAVPLTANFDALPGNASLGTTYTEGGIKFESLSPAPLVTANGSFAATLHGWGGYIYEGNTLFTHSPDWVSISASGSLLDSVSFKYGFDWNGYTIEFGLMDTRLEWQAWQGSTLTGSGVTMQGTQTLHYHGGSFVTINPLYDFDRLLIRSTATEYQGIATGPLVFERGPVIGWGTQNNIAFDAVSVALVATDPVHPIADRVPDGGSAAIMLGATVLLGWFAKHFPGNSAGNNKKDTQ